MSQVLQHLVMPNLAFGAPEEMYARLSNDKVHSLMSEGRLLFEAGGRASFDTFFNSVTVGAWKSHTAVADLQLHLRGTGRFILRLGLHRIGCAQRWLAESVVNLSVDKDCIVSVDSWHKLESGMLYFALEALEAGSLTSGCFATRTIAQSEVKLGIVITHFNRKEWVLPAIARIRDELLSDPLYSGRIELVVVDNSRNISPEEAKGITLIPNKNLGGSGGFTRGLLHLKDQKDFTHCLFMDDDASCEIESIRRSYNLLLYSVLPNLAIAGSMLREVEPHRLYEKGAKFNGLCRPLKSGMNMCDISDILFSELIDERPDYGGWWFFCFSIENVKEFPFPFFVRGDDIRFSISNNFQILTLNGISTWGDDFGLKAGPLPSYLDMRYHLMHSAFILNKKSFELIIFLLVQSFRQIFSLNYSSAEAMLIAASDFMSGPVVFSNDLDASAARSKIGGLDSIEKMGSVDRAEYKIIYMTKDESRFIKYLRLFTLNGLLIPQFLFKDNVIFQHKGFGANLKDVFLFKKIHYEYEPQRLGYVAKFDRIKAFKLTIYSGLLAIWILFGFAHVAKSYRKKIPYLTSEEFWRDVYSR